MTLTCGECGTVWVKDDDQYLLLEGGALQWNAEKGEAGTGSTQRVEETACVTDILSSRCLLAIQRLMLTEQFIQNLKLEELSELEIIIWDWWWRDVFISTAQYNFSVRQVNRKVLLQFCIYLQVTSLQFNIFLKAYGSIGILKIRVYYQPERCALLPKEF